MLVVDDTPERVPVIRAWLSKRYGEVELHHAHAVPEDLRGYDLVLLDYHIRGETAWDALKRLPVERLRGPRYLVHSMAGLEATFMEDWLKKQGLPVERVPYSLMRHAT